MHRNHNDPPRHHAVPALRLVGASALAGVLVAGLALPFVGGLGLGAAAAADRFNSTPDDLVLPTLSQASTIYDADGGVIATSYSRNRVVVPLAQIAPVMQQAIVDIEDHRFFDHGAIDLQGTLRALVKNAGSGGVSQGGSTLTQQYVKNIFVEKAGDDASAVREAQRQTTGRKIQELRYAIKLEQTLSKQDILGSYLNITYFGNSAYGIEAASQRYFSIHASQLTVPQAALLAGLVQSPSAYEPIGNPKAALARRDQVLTAMAGYGTITEADAARYRATGLNLKPSQPKEGCITAHEGAAFFCDYVEHIVLKDPAFGKTAEARQALWDQGGLQIRTTLSPKDQRALQAAVTAHVYPDDKAAAAMTMVEPGTGRILAMGQSRPYGYGSTPGVTSLNYNVDQSMGGAGGFQTGSTFKPITAAAALEQGIGMDQVYASPYAEDYPAMTDCKGNRLRAQPGNRNDAHSLVGPFNMNQAMAQSVNTYFVPLEGDTGLCNVVRMMNKLGITSQALEVHDKKTKKTSLAPIDEVQSLTLGTNNLTPLEMANVYATFAARGSYCSPTAITSVTTSAGKKLAVPAADCHQVMQQSTADKITTMLNGVVQDGTGTPVRFDDGRPSAGKTGTTNGSAQVWFVGYTPQLAGAALISDTASTTEHLDDGQTIHGRVPSIVTGGGLAGPVWHDAVGGALKGVDFAQFHLVDLPADARKAAPPDKSGEPKKADGTDGTDPVGGQ